MAIKTTCIQCQKPLSGPEDMLGKKIDCPACGTKNTLEPLEQRLNHEREEEDKKQLERQRKRDLERLAFLHEIGQKGETVPVATAPASPLDDIALRETPHLAPTPAIPPTPATLAAPAPPPAPNLPAAPERAQDLALIEDFAQAALVFAYLLAFLGLLGVVSAFAFEEPLRPLAALFALMAGLVAFLAFKYLGELSRLLLHLARGQDRLLTLWSLRQQADGFLCERKGKSPDV